MISPEDESIKSRGIAEAVDFIRYNNSFAIVFNDMEAETIQNLFTKDHNFSLQETIEIMIKAVQALGQIHKKNAVHNDIKPQNILYNQKTKKK